MRTVNYSEVLQLLSELAGIPYADLPTATALTYRGAISQWFRKAWEVEYWPELTRVDRRYYRPVWAAGTTYAAGAEVFFRGNTATSGAYYQSLRSQPLAVTSVTRVSTAVTVTTTANHGLVTGDWVTITGADQAEYNRNAEVTVTAGNTFRFFIVGTPVSPATGTVKASPNPCDDSGVTCVGWWYPCQSEYSGTDWTYSVASAQGDVVYYPVNDSHYACHTTSTGNLPTDTNYFGPLAVFDKYVGYTQTGYTAIGDVRDVYTKNPSVLKSYATCNWTLTQNGVQVPNGPAVVWLEYRTRFAPLIGSDYSASATYAVGDQILFNSSGSVKNFYTCAVVTTAGQSPNTTPASWTLLEIPYLFQSYLVHGAFADVLRMDGQMDKAAQQERLAEQYLEIEAAKLFNLQPQQQRMDMSAAY